MSHFQEIQNLYSATQNLWKAVNTITNITEPAYAALLQIESTGKRLMWNVYKYGVSASISAKFRNKIDSLANTFVQSAYKIPDVVQAAIHPMKELRNALDNYIPVNTPAQVKSNKKPNTVTNPPTSTPKPTEEQGAAYTGRSSEPNKNVSEQNESKPEVEISQPNKSEIIYNNPADVLKNILGRDVISFYSVPKGKWELEQNILEPKGFEYIEGFGIIPPNQKDLAHRIINEKWTKDPNYGYLNAKEYNLLKQKGYIK